LLEHLNSIIRSDIKVNREACVYRLKFKKRVMDKYGGARCKNCGNLDIRVLCLDHVFGGGTQHSLQMSGGGYKLARWAKKNDYPSTLQVLCANCNAIRGAPKEITGEWSLGNVTATGPHSYSHPGTGRNEMGSRIPGAHAPTTISNYLSGRHAV
jgi:hypothetical protein